MGSTLAERGLRAPFPWFGGKSLVASIVWQRFGSVPNYVEPFFGSGAVLLNRPHAPHIETINDKDCYVANFWRAVQQNPEEVTRWADTPVNEADLHARHLWLVQQSEFKERMFTEPEYYDAKIAGWWVWGLCAWIGGGWCEGKERPSRRLPKIGCAGSGIHSFGMRDTAGIMQGLSNRLRYVRVACGDWSRVTGYTPTDYNGLTGVFLDPPYSSESGRGGDVYAADSSDVAHAVREWAIANGDNPMLRIALCGYEGEHSMPDSWECIAWKANGGYGSQGNKQGRENAGRERIWFSPHCLDHQQNLFE